jgi:hypothetical protein
MAGRDDEARARAARARAIGLFRYQLVREAADPQLSNKARGRLVRAIAAREHTDPDGRRVRVSRSPGLGGGWQGCRSSSRMMLRTSSGPQGTSHRSSWAWIRR